MKEEKCPCCHNHCERSNLGCGKGKEYFRSNESSNNEPMTMEEQIISDLRRCGHMLHHNRELNANSLLSDFSESELKELHELLSKIE